jgi:hypothetical protein
LDYITALTSQAGGIGQINTWSGVQIHTANVSTTGSAQFLQPYNATTLDISTLVNRATLDSAIAGLGAGILNLDNIWGYANTNNLNGGIKTIQNATQFNPSLDANSYFITGVFPTTYTFSTNWIVNPVSGTTANVALDPAVFYFDTNHKYVISFTGIYGTSASWVGTVFNNSTSLTVSDASIAITTSPQNLSITFTAGSSNPTIYLRFVGASGTLRWTNFTIKEVDVEILGNLALSSEIDSNIIQSNGRTATLANGLKVNQTSLATATSLTTASLPAGVSASTLSGSYTLTATAGGTTFGVWLGSSFTFIAGAKYTFTFTGFSTNATATQAMILYTNTYTAGSGTFIGDYIVNVPITSSTVSGFFTATSNNNVVFNFVSSAAGRSISFTGFTLTRADTEITGVATLPTNTGTATTGLGLNSSNQIVNTAIPANFSAVSVGSVPYESAVDTFSNSLITQGTTDLGYNGGVITAFTGLASITFSSPTYTANSNNSVQGILTCPPLPSSVIGLPCVATFTGLTFPLFAVAPYPYFVLTNGSTIYYTSAVGASGTIVMPFTPISTTTIAVIIYFKAPPTGVSAPVLTWTNFTITTPSMITTGFSNTTGRQTVGELVASGIIRKIGGNSGANYCRLEGTDAGASPYAEFFFNNLRRMFIGFATATTAQITTENGALLNLSTEGVSRMTIDTAGNITQTGGIFRKSSASVNSYMTINGGDVNNSPFLEFFFGGARRSYIGNATASEMQLSCENGARFNLLTAGSSRFAIESNGETNIALRLTVGGSNSSGIINVRNPNGSFTHLGWTDNLNYFRGAGNIFDGYIQLNSVAFGLPRIQSPNNLRSMLYDDGNGLTYLQNISGATPIPFTHSSWGAGSGGGYTLISRAQGVNVMALGFGVSDYRAVIMSLAPAISWGELILSAGTIYTSCFGTINNYTNGGGWVFVSDKRVKKDIKDIKTARSLQRIMALKPKTYKKIYRQELSDTPIPQEVIDADHIGLIAQDVQEINPHCISEWVDDNCVCDGDDGKRLGINYGDINIHMVGAIQELKKQNDAQQKEIEAQRKELEEFREVVRSLILRVEKIA